MFSGFKSQCTISTSCRVRKARDFSSCRENFRIRFKDTPLNLYGGRRDALTFGSTDGWSKLSS